MRKNAAAVSLWCWNELILWPKQKEMISTRFWVPCLVCCVAQAGSYSWGLCFIWELTVLKKIKWLTSHDVAHHFDRASSEVEDLMDSLLQLNAEKQRISNTQQIGGQTEIWVHLSSFFHYNSMAPVSLSACNVIFHFFCTVCVSTFS